MNKFLLALAGVALTATAASADTVTFDFINEAYGMERLSGTTSQYNPDNTVIKQEDSPITITVNSGTRLWADGLRCYKNGTFVVTGAKVSNVVFEATATMAADEDPNFTSTPEGLVGNAWSGSAEELTIAYAKTSKNVAIKTVTITYEANGGEVNPGLKNPGLEFFTTEWEYDGNEWLENKVKVNQVFCEEFWYWNCPELDNPYDLPITWTSSRPEVAKVGNNGIVYFYGEEDFDENGDLISDAEPVCGSTVITASFAGNDEYEAMSVSYTIYQYRWFETMSDLVDAYNAGEWSKSEYALLANLCLIYQNGKNNYCVAQYYDYENDVEGFAPVMIYGNIDFKEGDIIESCVGTLDIYNGLPEFIPMISSMTLYGTMEDIEMEFVPETVELADVANVPLNSIIVVPNVTFADATPADVANITGVNGETSVTFRNTFKVASVEAGTYDVKCAVSIYKDTIQLLPIEYTASVEDGVNGVVAAQSEAKFFNLQGVRVANPERGLFIKVQNGKAAKIVK